MEVGQGLLEARATRGYVTTQRILCDFGCHRFLLHRQEIMKRYENTLDSVCTGFARLDKGELVCKLRPELLAAVGRTSCVTQKHILEHIFRWKHQQRTLQPDSLPLLPLSSITAEQAPPPPRPVNPMKFRLGGHILLRDT